MKLIINILRSGFFKAGLEILKSGILKKINLNLFLKQDFTIFFHKDFRKSMKITFTHLGILVFENQNFRYCKLNSKFLNNIGYL